MKKRILPILFSSILIVVVFTLLNSPPAFAAMSFRPIESDEFGHDSQVFRDDHDVAIAAPAAVIIVSSDITSNTTWIAGNVYVLATDIRIWEGVKLTINPGTVIKPQRYVRLIVSGILNARGTAANPIVFTSYKDDSFGGDTNNDGTASTPAPDDWAWIEFQDTSVDSQNILEHCTILYGGSLYTGVFYDRGAVYLISASPTISHCTIANNGNYAIGIDTGSFPTVVSNTFANNGTNGIGVYGGSISAAGTWTSANYPYVLDADVTITQSASLTISPGVTVKARTYVRLIVSGVLNARGTAANPIVFTSYQDDSFGGDTNNDGAASAPAPNDWAWIEFRDTSVDSQNILEHCTILYGGSLYTGTLYDRGAVYLISASPTISRCTIANNGNYAIGAEVDSFPIVSGNVITHNGTNGIGIYSGTMTASSGRWSSTDAVYVLDADVTIAQGASLTISPGVTVKARTNVRLNVNGILNARGTGTNPIVFTSYQDDSFGGDTNNDGTASAPAPNDWAWIEFRDTSVDSQNILEHCTILYGGSLYTGVFYDRGAVYLISASPTISHCTIAHNGNYAIGAEVDSFPIVSGNVITYNGTNGIGIYSGTMTASSGRWSSTDAVYVLDADVTIAQGGKLTLSPGVIVKGQTNSRLIVGGALEARGTAVNPIVFTSLRDDTYGGDTDGDPGASAPAPGDWGWIEFTDTSVDSQDWLTFAVIKYAGHRDAVGDLGAVRLISASPTISRCTISNNQPYGISTSASTPTLGCNDIFNNSTYGLYNATTNVTVTAQNQWWGSTTGPYHSTNITGTGNAVSNGVDFRPWRLALCGTLLVTPTVVIISGPVTGVVNTGYTFTATVSPTSTTQPITYIWRATGQAPVTNTGGLSNSVTLTWTISGAQTITATATNVAGTATGRAYFTVLAGPVARITITPNLVTVRVGMTQTFTATGTDASGNAVPINPAWSTDAGTMAGNVLTAQTAPASGRHVTATVGSVNGTAIVNVATGPLASITVTPNPATVLVGATQTFNASGADAFGNVLPISPVWSTDAGTLVGNVLTAQTTPATGKHVTATVGSMSGVAIVYIVTELPVTITVTPNPVTVTVGATQPFTAVGADAHGNFMPITPTWTTDAGTLAGNILTAQTTPANGRHITATVASVSGTAVVNVAVGPLDRLVITPTAVTLAVHQTQQFSATGFDVYSNTVRGLPLTWYVTLADAGKIDATGLFTSGTKGGKYPGAVVVSSGVLSDTADVTVRWPCQLYLPIVLR